MQKELKQWINEYQFKELLEGTNNSPGKLLGIHEYGKGQVIIAYRPCAQKIRITDGKHTDELALIDEAGVFALYLPKAVYKK